MYTGYIPFDTYVVGLICSTTSIIATEQKPKSLQK